MWWHTPLTSILLRQWQVEFSEFETNLVYIVCPRLNTWGGDTTHKKRKRFYGARYIVQVMETLPSIRTWV